jgi:hypothetical protein
VEEAIGETIGLDFGVDNDGSICGEFSSCGLLDMLCRGESIRTFFDDSIPALTALLLSIEVSTVKIKKTNWSIRIFHKLILSEIEIANLLVDLTRLA